MEGLEGLSRREGVTLFMTMLGVFEVLLSRYSGQEEVLVGTPIAGRNRVETEGLIGFFVNTLVMRGDLAWGSDVSGVSGEGEGGGAGGVRAPGRALRAAGGGVEARTQPDPQPALPGHVRVRRGPGGEGGPPRSVRRGGGLGGRNLQVRSDPVPAARGSAGSRRLSSMRWICGRWGRSSG